MTQPAEVMDNALRFIQWKDNVCVSKDGQVIAVQQTLTTVILTLVTIMGGAQMLWTILHVNAQVTLWAEIAQPVSLIKHFDRRKFLGLGFLLSVAK